MFSGPGSPESEGSLGKNWQVQDARARFSELLEVSLAEGAPIRRHG